MCGQGVLQKTVSFKEGGVFSSLVPDQRSTQARGEASSALLPFPPSAVLRDIRVHILPSHGSNGLCRPCHTKIGDRLRSTDARLQRQFNHEQDGAAKEFLRRLESAKELLSDLKGIMKR